MAEQPAIQATHQDHAATGLPNHKPASKWFQKILLKGDKRTPYNIESEKINKLDVEEVKFYLEQVEKQLQDSVDTGQVITERATNLLNLTSALLIALIAYSIDRWESFKQWDPLLNMAVWGCCILTMTSALLIIAILPKQYCIPGWTPDKIFNSRSFNEGSCKDIRQKNIAVNLILNYEGDIQENNSLNKKRWTFFNLSMLIFLISPICFASYYLLFR